MAQKPRKNGDSGKVTSPVKGGWVKREERSGRFVQVQSESGTFCARPKSEDSVNEAATRRYSALKRLADR